MEQRFSAGPQTRIRIERVSGEVQVFVWDESDIRVQADGRVRELYQEGDDLVLQGSDDEVTLHVPSSVSVFLSGCDDDVRVEGVRRVELERISSDVVIEDIAEEVVVSQLASDLRVERAPLVTGRGKVSGEVSLEDVARATFTRVDSDLHAERVQNLSVEAVGGDLHVDGVTERLGVGSVGGDLHVDGASGATVAVGSVGGDMHVEGDAAALELGSIGGDLHADRPCPSIRLGSIGGDLVLDQVGQLKAGNIGSDLRVRGVSERLEVGNIGGDADLKSVQGSLELGPIGGDLSLRAELRPGSAARAMVGGDVSVSLGAEPNLLLNALVSGDVRGADVGGEGRKRLSLRYGAGEATLDLTIGGDLRISGGPRPESHSASAGIGPDFGREWADFGREMGDLGRELGRLGREIAEEVSASLASEGVAGGRAWAEGFARKFDAKARAIQEKAEERARRAEEKAREVEEKTRMRIKINEREWQLDPERLERIKEQARRAAADGLQGAMEAVERALSRVAVPPVAPVPPVPPTPPVPPSPPTPATGQTIKIELDNADARSAAPADSLEQDAREPLQAAPTTPSASVEQERETILRMIAEGRISPEEGDLLLEALGS